jgi:hypothetical protein
MEKTPVGEPRQIFAPDEITLAQLVSYFVLPEMRNLDVGTVFYWCLEEVADESKADKTKRRIVQIPYNIPMGFVLRVKANTLHENSRKRTARCKFGSVPLCFSRPEDGTVGRLRERVIELLRQRGQGEDWTIEGPEREVIDFEYEYPVVPTEREIPIQIFLKQKEIEVMSSESWMHVSDKLVQAYHLPLGTLFRIYPVIGEVQDRDPDDGSYSITWEAGKQYWFDIVYDEGKDPRGEARQIRMVDYGGRVETFVVPVAAAAQQVAELWREVLEVTAGIGVEVRTGNDRECFC